MLRFLERAMDNTISFTIFSYHQRYLIVVARSGFGLSATRGVQVYCSILGVYPAFALYAP